jgi:AraC family transcriptional regulator
MTVTYRLLALGPGWRVADVVCTASKNDRPFEEQHTDFCIAAVTDGTFRYRTRQGMALLAAGSLLLGNARTCYECGHEHAAGDRCLSFHFSPGHLEGIIADVPGARRLDFRQPRLPALPQLAPLLAQAEVARDEGDKEALEELGIRLAGAVASQLTGTKEQAMAPNRFDEKRVSEAVRRIEADASDPVSLAELARATATSPYHFLRTFRQVTGMTPYQFVLRTRLHRAAVSLRASDEPISAIAFDAGFNDLSTFNRRFRRIMGSAPTEFRKRRVP